MKQAKPAAPSTLSGRERWTYYMGGFGQGMIYAAMSNYISDFYLNVMRLNAVFVLLLMLLARLWDAINDPLMGVIMDRAQPKRGKMRGYFYVVPWPIILLTLALFFAPNYYISGNIGQTALMAYAAVTYVLWGMTYTVGDIPFWSLPNAMVAEPGERGRLIAVSRTVNGVGSAIPQGLFMAIGPLLAAAGFQNGVRLEQTRYMLLAGFVTVVGGVLYFRTAGGVRERVPIPRAAKKSAGEPGALSLIFHNRPLLLVVAMGILSAGRYMFAAGMVHVARYSVGFPGRDVQSSISTVSLIFQLSIAGGMFGSMLLLPKLMERFRYKHLVIFTGLLGGVAGLAVYFAGYGNVYALIPLLFVCGIPYGIINNLSYAMISDTLDYMEWKTGFRTNGLGQGCQTFVNKLDNALATSAVVLVYILLKLDVNQVMGGGAAVHATQMPAQIRGGFFTMISLVPAVSLFLCVIPMFFYSLEGETKTRMTRELAQRRAGAAL
ncbi:MAG: MFS transporter [Oscillospiraceae bacterium]|nr:MFS transporter [Oscillospiraceae bacterium]